MVAASIITHLYTVPACTTLTADHAVMAAILFLDLPEGHIWGLYMVRLHHTLVCRGLYAVTPQALVFVVQRLIQQLTLKTVIRPCCTMP